MVTCVTNLWDYAGWQIGSRDILVSSSSELHCDHPGIACYELIAILADGTVLYQNLTNIDVAGEGELLACTALLSLGVDELSALESAINSVNIDASFFEDLSELVACRSDPSSDDYGVDNYRAPVRPPGGFMPVVVDNLGCRGYLDAVVVKRTLDTLWARAPRDLIIRL